MRRHIWAGLDIGVETTSICVINDAGDVLQQAICSSDLDAIHKHLRWLRRRRFATVGLEAGALTLARGLRSLGYAVEMYETRQLSKFLRVRRNKTDTGDAIGIAEAGRIGASLVSKVHLKSLECQSLQSRLTIRKHLIRQRVAAVNLLCRKVEHYGGRIRGPNRSVQLREVAEKELRRLFGKQSTPLSAELRCLLSYCEHLITYQQVTDRELKSVAMASETCRTFMEIPGVGPICALTFYATVAEPHRFKRSSTIGSYFGLTPRIHQSGLTLRTGRISRMGNAPMRSLLVQSAIAFMRSNAGDPELRRWTLEIERRSGRGQSRVALARKLAVIMLAMWKAGEHYNPRAISEAGLPAEDGVEPYPEATSALS